jgi:hypothetical protein
MTDADIEEYAKLMLTTKRGIGMIPQFYAETASTKGNIEWPFWIVRNKTCNSTAQFYPREISERLADAMNRAVS